MTTLDFIVIGAPVFLSDGAIEPHHRVEHHELKRIVDLDLRGRVGSGQHDVALDRDAGGA